MRVSWDAACFSRLGFNQGTDVEYRDLTLPDNYGFCGAKPTYPVLKLCVAESVLLFVANSYMGLNQYSSLQKNNIELTSSRWKCSEESWTPHPHPHTHTHIDKQWTRQKVINTLTQQHCYHHTRSSTAWQKWRLSWFVVIKRFHLKTCLKCLISRLNF